jgi:hypothetical protein
MGRSNDYNMKGDNMLEIISFKGIAKTMEEAIETAYRCFNYEYDTNDTLQADQILAINPFLFSDDNGNHICLLKVTIEEDKYATIYKPKETT